MNAPASATAQRSDRAPLFELGLDMLGMLLMALEYLQAGFEQVLQFRVGG
jgi:hypothetical protein